MLGLQASTRIDGGAATTRLGFNVLQLLVISIVVGVAALKVGERANAFLSFNESLLAITRKILWWVIRLTPIGTIGLLGNAVAQYGWQTLQQLSWYAFAIYLGLAIVLLIVYPVLLVLHGLSPLRFFAGAWPAIQLAFVSRSSVGTLPVTEAVTREEPRRAPRIRRLRRAARRDHQDGRLRCDLPGDLGDLRRAVLRRPARHPGICADRLRLGDRLGRDRGP
jgi:Na+/H+-dicarboxylate symporter